MSLSGRLPSIVAHCDWGTDPKKRWMCVAIRDQQEWKVGPTELVGDLSTLLQRLSKRRMDSGEILIGFDFPIGLPMAYMRAAGLPDFRAALKAFGTGKFSRWFDPAEAASEISMVRPFYPERPGGTKQIHLLNALGLPDMQTLQRACERKTPYRNAASPLFWTLGGKQVGKAAISGWRDFLKPQLETLSIWPHDGPLDVLLGRNRPIVAETYPGDIYHSLGIPRSGWSKRKQNGREMALGHVFRHLPQIAAIDMREINAEIADAFGTTSNGEDRFDAFIGVLGMLNVISGNKPACPDLPSEIAPEGWIFGMSQTFT